jgi:hypothetical protein
VPELDADVSAWITEQLSHAPELTTTAAQRLSRLLFGASE